jgi:phenylalanyl-tRNA synthetase beta chain
MLTIGSITVPTYKTDVTRQADIIEEIVRIYGLNNIEETGKFAFSMPEKIRNEVAEARQIRPPISRRCRI